MKHKFFTIVLISTAGIIAAIVISQIYVRDFIRHAAAVKIKKCYSLLNQAEIRAQADGIDWKDWVETAYSKPDSSYTTTQTFAHEYLLPYLVYLKTNIRGADTYIYFKDDSYIKLQKGECINFIYDINGDNKPNTEGRDIFRFLYCPPASAQTWIEPGKIIPCRKKTMTTRENALEMCKSSGMYCTALLFFDNWEFKNDYPYDI